MSDPRYTDPRLNQPMLRRDEKAGGVWGWIAGIAVLALIAFILVAGWKSGTTNSAHNGLINNPPITTGAAPTPATPPSTTGSGSTSPAPLTPAPQPPANSRTQ